MEHTKGKWEVSKYREKEIWVGANTHIATCHGFGDDVFANAQLIAAAPETERQRDALLAACNQIAEHRVLVMDDEGETEADAMAKIAKAAFPEQGTKPPTEG